MGSSALTTLDTALAGVAALGFDTVPFIYLIERHPHHFGLVRAVFRRMTDGSFPGYTSIIALTELLTKPYREHDTVIANRYRILLARSRNLTLLPLDTQAAEVAASLRARHNLRTPDALQIAAAIAAGCDAFLTNDHALRRVTEIPVLLLDDLTL
ncbi:MAG: PIN domain-containing protein [Chloroflexota bacterium]|nr:PIN domain-containing protein [Chloroflexota bacterium]